MKVDVIIPLANLVPTALESRVEILNYAIEHFYAKQTGIDIRIVLVEQSLDGKYYYLPNIDVPLSLRRLDVRIEYPKFCKGWCINHGFAAGGTKYVFIADADMWAESDYLGKMVDWMQVNRHNWAFAWDQLYYTEYLEKRQLLVEGRENIKRFGFDKIHRPERGLSEGGIVCFKRDFFKKMGYSHEWMMDLGGPDNEQAERARKFSDPGVYRQFIYHLQHEQTPKSARDSRHVNIYIGSRGRQQPDKMMRFISQWPVAGPHPQGSRGRFKKLWMEFE